MNRARVEVDLLFGLLALQNDLIDRDALVAAFQGWTRDKQRPLAEHLVRQGVLDAADRDAVETLVRRYLLKHGDDLEQSLAQLKDVDAVGEQLRALADPDLEATLGLVGKASLTVDGEGSSERTTSYVLGEPGAAGSRFHLLRPLARGGIGQVGVALDSELNREVALKEIQPQLADDPTSRGRFLLEAEITGRLEHPGVVPVYGLGLDPQGRPFYAMRLIRGDSLKQAIERFHAAESSGPDRSERALALRELLNRFVDVCNTVAYAHSRGVIHRDIKPSNVMLGPFGETLVVDWGLAKVVGREDPMASSEATLRPWGGSGSSETQAGSAIGTPAYMSPEQAEGRLDAIGPPSDVYSLGATLYCLLTGRPPIEEEEIGALLQRVQRGEFTPPHAVKAEVPAALGAITLRAMALKPSDRYPNPRTLAGDVEHWLAGEPVSAYAEPPSLRLARWARRHRTTVATAAALLVTATAALGVGTVLLGRANSRIQQERNEAGRQRDEAQRQRDLAHENFDRARAAVNTYLSQVSEEQLLNQPGLEPLRERLLRSALTYYEDFIRQRSDDPSLRFELADAYRSAGEIIGAIGSRAEAAQHIQRAINLFQQVSGSDPRNIHARAGLARALMALAFFEIFDDRGVEGEASAARAIPLFESLRDQMPESSEFARSLGRCYDLMGIGCATTGRVREALPHGEKAVAILEDAVRRFPSDLESRWLLARALNNRAAAFLLLGQLDESRAALDRAASHYRELLEKEPSNSRYQVGLTRVLTNIGRQELARGHVTDAAGPLREAERQAAALARGSPDVTEYLALLVDAFELRAIVESSLGHAVSARELIRRCLDQHAVFARKDALNDDVRETFASTYRTLGLLESRDGNDPAAQEAFRQAIALFEKISKERSGDHGYRAQFLMTREDRLRTLRPTGDPAELARRLDEQKAIVAGRDELLHSDFDPPARQAELARGLLGLASLSLDAGNPAEARTLLERANALIDEAARARPSAFDVRRLRIEALQTRARLVGSSDDRRSIAGQLVNAAEELARLDPAYLYDLAVAHSTAAQLAGDASGEQARSHLGKAIDVLRRAVAEGLDDVARLTRAPELQPLRDRREFLDLVQSIPGGRKTSEVPDR